MGRGLRTLLCALVFGLPCAASRDARVTAQDELFPPPPLEHAGAVHSGLVNPFSAQQRQPGLVDVFGDSETWTRLPASTPETEFWTWQLLPDGVIYHSYLAGVKEPRFASVWNHDATAGNLWDIALGGRVGILRYGTEAAERAEGWELDFEGAAFPRLDRDLERDLVAIDFRVGLPLTYGYERWQTKLAYYHSCAHLGDQFMLRFPDVPRTDYSRDAIVWGNSYFPIDALRLYAEVSWAFRMWGVAKPWEFQVGADYSPLATARDFRGSPFAAVNAHFREDVDYAGDLVVQVGWQWRGATGHLFRLGAQYFNGNAETYEFFRRQEQKIGFGIWYDF
ncbi:MAG: DUF1207 domain-containing protein [Planctomycetota bacterium]|nr:DUF1207 domain-containing protein [Planctomycetota bacterium]